MEYDIFTYEENLAEEIQEKIDKAYMVDTSTKPDMFQFLNVSEQHMVAIKRVLYNSPNCFEIRDSKTGDFVWPARNASTLEQALDLLC